MTSDATTGIVWKTDFTPLSAQSIEILAFHDAPIFGHESRDGSRGHVSRDQRLVFVGISMQPSKACPSYDFHLMSVHEIG